MNVATIDPLSQAIHDQVAQQPKKGRPSGGKGTTNRDIQYVCDCCKRDVGRDHIFARQVSFIDMVSKRRKRTRTVDWVCDECVLTHPDYLRQSHVEAPGMKDVLRAKGS